MTEEAVHYGTPPEPNPSYEDVKRAIAEVKRELALRKRVYARYVSTGRMTQQQANTHMEGMQMAHTILELYKSTIDPQLSLLRGPQ